MDGVVPEGQRADPVGADVSFSRDGCRTPMPWELGPSFGFSDSVDTWLPLGDRAERDTAAWQRNQPGSWLDRYRRLIALRRSDDRLRTGPFAWSDGFPPDVIAFRRGGLVVALNAGISAASLDLSGSLLFDSFDELSTPAPIDCLVLQPDQAVVVEVSAP